MKHLLIAILITHAHAITHNPAYARADARVENFINETEAMAWEGYGVCGLNKDPLELGTCRAQMMIRVVAMKHAKVCYKAFKRSPSSDWDSWNQRTKCFTK